MKRCSTKDLRKLEIINLCDGTRLGCASDFEFDCEDAKILALVIAGSDGIFGVGREDDIIIPWHKIECFGEDTILVRVTHTDFGALIFCGFVLLYLSKAQKEGNTLLKCKKTVNKQYFTCKDI